MITILDYGAGNLTSVAFAVRHLGEKPLITSDPDDLRRSERIIFPGVGAAGASMENLERLGLGNAIRDAWSRGTPILGICIGCQVIFTHSEEDGGTPCLGLLGGNVQKFQFAPGVERKIPHMGWNEVRFTTTAREHPVFHSVGASDHFYFVHSYFPCPSDGRVVYGTAVYGGVEFAAALAKDNLVAVQFHAEKSGSAGLSLLASFLRWSP